MKTSSGKITFCTTIYGYSCTGEKSINAIISGAVQAMRSSLGIESAWLLLRFRILTRVISKGLSIRKGSGWRHLKRISGCCRVMGTLKTSRSKTTPKIECSSASRLVLTKTCSKCYSPKPLGLRLVGG